MSRNRCFLISVSLALCPLFFGCGKIVDPWKDVPGGPTKILVSTPALYCFAKQIAGPHAAVMCLSPTVGPHHYEPATDDPLKAAKADLVLYNGLALDDQKITSLVKNSGNAKAEVVAVAEKAIDRGKFIMTAGQDHGDHVHPAGPDPHVWLGIDETVNMVHYINATLQRLVPEHKDVFQKRSEALVVRLNELKKYGQEKFRGKRGHLITMHDSLRYFARTFQIKLFDSIQTQPGIHADAAKFKELVAACEKLGGRFIITTEPQYSKGSPETLRIELERRGIDVRMAEVDTIETADVEALTRDPASLDGDFYLRVMKQNIDNLAEQMQ